MLSVSILACMAPVRYSIQVERCRTDQTARARAPHEADATSVNPEQDWPGNRGSMIKAPSIVAFREDNPNHKAFRGGLRSLFGFEVTNDMNSCSFFKVCLDSDARSTEFDNPILKEEIASKLVSISSPRENRRAVEAAMMHVCEIERRRMADNFGEEILNDVGITWVLPYPAACSEKGKALTRQAAQNAGWLAHSGDSIEMISEAHAAATACYVSQRACMGNVAWKQTFKVSRCPCRLVYSSDI